MSYLFVWCPRDFLLNFSLHSGQKSTNSNKQQQPDANIELSVGQTKLLSSVEFNTNTFTHTHTLIHNTHTHHIYTHTHITHI